MSTKLFWPSLVVMAVLALPALASAQATTPTTPAATTCTSPVPARPDAHDGQRAAAESAPAPTTSTAPAVSTEAHGGGARVPVGVTLVTVGTISLVAGLGAGLVTATIGAAVTLVGSIHGGGSYGEHGSDGGSGGWFALAGVGLLSVITGAVVLAAPDGSRVNRVDAPQVSFAAFPRRDGAEVAIGVRF